jgi:hypothetical protein
VAAAVSGLSSGIIMPSDRMDVVKEGLAFDAGEAGNGAMGASPDGQDAGPGSNVSPTEIRRLAPSPIPGRSGADRVMVLPSFFSVQPARGEAL